jgi:hypothetical protein
MANLADLKDVGDGLKQIWTDLAALKGKPVDNPGPEQAVIDKLTKLVSESDQATQADVDARAAAIVSNRSALTGLVMAAASNANPIQLDPQKLIVINAQITALGNAYGLLLERQAFQPIATLLSNQEMTKITSDLKGARVEIQKRKEVQAVIDLMVDVAITGAKIAVKLGIA